MNIITQINSIFNKHTTYSFVNSINHIKLRNISDGISLNNALLYDFLYVTKDITRANARDDICDFFNIDFKRQSFDSKKNNISVDVYKSIFKDLKSVYSYLLTSSTLPKIADNVIATDGIKNNNNLHQVVSNMGYYDVTKQIPLDITFHSTKNTNVELKEAREFIKNNLETFTNNIVVFDALYFCYDFMIFLNDLNLKFIICVRGDAQNLKNPIKLDKCPLKTKNLISSVKKFIRIVDGSYETNSNVIDNSRGLEYFICEHHKHLLITNLNKSFSDEQILKLYTYRWNIETFFKLIKYNFKFQNLKEKENDSLQNYLKLYICELIIVILSKIFQCIYLGGTSKNASVINNKLNLNEDDFKYQINNSRFLHGFNIRLLYKILNGKLSIVHVNRTCEIYIDIIKNKNNRSFKRISKKPHSKWYGKASSNNAKLNNLLYEILKNKIKNNKYTILFCQIINYEKYFKVISNESVNNEHNIEIQNG